MPKPALTASTSATPSSARVLNYVVILGVCFAADVFDGYDLIVYGSSVPALLQYRPWGLTPTVVGAIGSYALVGMFFGALGAGALADRFGRKRTMVASLTLYSLAMVGTAVASSAAMFGTFRLIAGLGFGAVVPTSVALVVECAPKNRRNLFSGLMTAGFAVGGIVAALLAILLLRDYGFRPLFALGGLPLVTVVPLALWLVPESPAYIRRADRSAGAEVAKSRPLRDLLQGRALVMILLFGVANFCIGVVVFGLNTWLPQLMSRAGYSLGSALLFQLLLNAGAIAGAVVGSLVADRKGARGVATTFFLLASICICVLGTGLSAATLYVVVLVAGVGATGTQIVLFGYVATHFDVSLRGRALGLTTGFARLGGVLGPALGGYLVAAHVGLSWDLTVFAAFAVVGAVASFTVPRRRQRARSDAEPSVPADGRPTQADPNISSHSARQVPSHNRLAQ